MGQSLGRQTGHSGEGNPWQRDMTDEGKQLSAERHTPAHLGYITHPDGVVVPVSLSFVRAPAHLGLLLTLGYSG